MSFHPDEPGPAEIEAVLHYLPPLQATRAADAQVETVAGLVQALYDNRWIYDFDWAEWQPVAERYQKNPSLLHDAGVGTLRKLFTTHVRREQFNAGHLAEIAQSGHLAALLERLHQLRGPAEL